MLTVLIVIGSIIFYAMVSMVVAGYRHVCPNDLFGNRYKKQGKRYSDPGVLFPSVFWPIAIPIWLVVSITRPCLKIGQYIHSLEYSSQEKRETVKLQKSIEQKKLRIELEKAEQELDEELASNSRRVA